MVEIITAENKWKFRKQLTSTFEDRKRVFVDLLRWDVAVTDDGLEMDQFDGDEAVYVVMSGAAGEHMGSLRLLKTDGPHILGDLFSHLCTNGVPTSAGILEITRFCLSPRLPAAERLRVRNHLISRMVDHTLAQGIEALTGVVTERFLLQIMKMGWRCERLGPVGPGNGSKLAAFQIHVDEATPRPLEATGIYVPVLEAGTSANEVETGRVDAAYFPGGATSNASGLWLSELKNNGYCIVRDAVAVSSVDQLNTDLDQCFAETPYCEGDFYGRRTKRFGGLLRRSPVAAEFVSHPLILEIAGQVLGPWCDRFNLNLTQAIEVHPGAPAQFPHRDQDMWEGVKGQMEYLLNVMWPLTSFTEENGATRIWPGSQNGDLLDQPIDAEPLVAEMRPGDALLFRGSTLHCAGANQADSIRRGLIISYCLGWLKPFENQWLCYPPDVARHFDPALAELIGYSLHRPNLGNYEGQSPSVLLGDDLPAYLAATDALRPDQEMALREFIAGKGATQSRNAAPYMSGP